jgi:hypothetical protein
LICEFSAKQGTYFGIDALALNDTESQIQNSEISSESNMRHLVFKDVMRHLVFKDVKRHLVFKGVKLKTNSDKNRISVRM